MKKAEIFDRLRKMASQDEVAASSETPVEQGRGASGKAKGKAIEMRSDALNIPLDRIEVKPQVRKYFDPEEIRNLVRSIVAHGLQQPVVVRQSPRSSRWEQYYELQTGERRFRAFQLLFNDEEFRETPMSRKYDGRIPATVSADGAPSEATQAGGEPDERAGRELEASIVVKQLIENLQRSDLNGVELADTLALLTSKRGNSPGLELQEIARQTGMSAYWLGQVRKIAGLPEGILEAVRKNPGRFPVGSLILLSGRPLSELRQLEKDPGALAGFLENLRSKRRKGRPARKGRNDAFPAWSGRFLKWAAARSQPVTDKKEREELERMRAEIQRLLGAG